MKRFVSLALILLPAMLAAQTRTLIDDGWEFRRLPVASTAEVPAWRSVTLPHDWSIEPLHGTPDDTCEVVGPFSRASVGGTATGHTVGGVGSYRRILSYQPAEGQCVGLYFEGAYNESRVVVNGTEVGRNVYGYSAFRIDVTRWLHAGDNLIEVECRNEGRNSRWYAGSGLYRHVWLETYPEVHLDPWETQVSTSRLDGITPDATAAASGYVAVHTRIANPTGQARYGRLTATLVDPKGRTMATHSMTVNLMPADTTDVRLELKAKGVRLWAPAHPALYRLRLRLDDLSDGSRQAAPASQIVVTTGLRTLRLDPERGLLLNGEELLLHGGCIHHDNGLLGAAAFDRAELRKVELIRREGFNAVRGSHNPMSEYLLYACDSVGMMVIDEAFDTWHLQKNKQDYHLYFDEHCQHDLQTLVRRDRNHPSVVAWSVGNEIRERAYSDGVAIGLRLRGYIHELDTTRPITAGINSLWNKDRTARASVDSASLYLDLTGFNYRPHSYADAHARHPGWLFVGTESVAAEAAIYWQEVVGRPYVVGDFVWTAMDYLGEAGIANLQTDDAQENVHYFMPWPWYNGWCGDLDLIGQKKPQSYYRDVVWGRRPIAMAVEPLRLEVSGVPSATPPPYGCSYGRRPRVSFWGWIDEQPDWTLPPAHEGDSVRVNIYTRAPRVNLYLNDAPVAVGVEVNDSTLQASVMVVYHPGTLRAEIAQPATRTAIPLPDCLTSVASTETSCSLSTVGPATALRPTADRTTLRHDGQDLSFVLVELVDAEGRRVRDSSLRVDIALSGGGAVVAGSGNAAPDDMASFGSLSPRLYMGQAMVILRATTVDEPTVLTLTAEGLPMAQVVVR